MSLLSLFRRPAPLVGPEAVNLDREVSLYRSLFGSPVAAVCAVIIIGWVLAALVSPLFGPYDAYSIDLPNRLEAPSGAHWLGTDEYGRDVLTRLTVGARTSLLVGAATVAVTMTIGTAVGVIAGFSRVFSAIAMRVIDALLAFPSLLFALFLAGTLGQGTGTLLIALSATFAPLFARVAYGEMRAIVNLDYVQSARVLGCSRARILLRHMLPQMSSPLIVQASYVLAAAILFEASLSFLGAGVPPPTPSWGAMVSAGKGYMSQAWWLLWPVAAALTSLVLSASLLSDRLRDVLDPHYVGKSGGERLT